jgi:hypothetical protein
MRPVFVKNQRLRRIAYFFPVQLFLVVLKKNQVLLLFWACMFGFITKMLAAKFGVPFLFLNPEYMGRTSFWSYLITGFACGGFIMAYNISVYIVNGFRFPFLATLANPFFKFCLNNCIIPLIFFFTYLYAIYDFLIRDDQANNMEIFKNISGFVVGNVSFIIFSLVYFRKFNKDIFKLYNLKEKDHEHHAKPRKMQRVVLKRNMEWNVLNPTRRETRDWHVETYLSHFTRISLARGYEHYEKEMLIRVFKQNHFNAAVFGIISIISLLTLGWFREIPFFEIPAGASVFLLFTMFLMLTSALHTWLRGWSTTASILMLLLLNFIYFAGPFNSASNAYGLKYDGERAEYSQRSLHMMENRKDLREQDIEQTTTILEKWKTKNTEHSLETGAKPKLVLINTSGGGLRSAMWTFYSLQYTDSLLDGELLNHTQLITGSSGGMIGAAYLRELYLQYKLKKRPSIYGDSLLVNISKDILNPVAFSVATNDLFFRVQKTTYAGQEYCKDRGFAFESKLNENTNQVLEKQLGDYRAPEANAVIPMMILCPTVVNDGRKLLISPQHISYLTQNWLQSNVYARPLIENIEYSRFFEKQGAENLRFTSALRMNATFPYITPIVSLPSEPEIEVMDAGMRDNYGLETTLKFLYTFHEWIEANTSGVIILQIRDRHKEFPIEESEVKTITGTLSRPLGSFYGNWFYIQDFEQNQMLQYASAWFKGTIDVIDFELRNEKPDNISLSWHLTNREKNKVRASLLLPGNQESIQRLKSLLVPSRNPAPELLNTGKEFHGN